MIPEALAGPRCWSRGLRFAVTFNDVRKLSGIRDRQARTDELTGLANRRQFYAQLERGDRGLPGTGRPASRC